MGAGVRIPPACIFQILSKLLFICLAPKFGLESTLTRFIGFLPIDLCALRRRRPERPSVARGEMPSHNKKHKARFASKTEQKKRDKGRTDPAQGLSRNPEEQPGPRSCRPPLTPPRPPPKPGDLTLLTPALKHLIIQGSQETWRSIPGPEFVYPPFSLSPPNTGGPHPSHSLTQTPDHQFYQS